jgi:hypothetical protein
MQQIVQVKLYIFISSHKSQLQVHSKIKEKDLFQNMFLTFMVCTVHGQPALSPSMVHCFCHKSNSLFLIMDRPYHILVFPALFLSLPFLKCKNERPAREYQKYKRM